MAASKEQQKSESDKLFQGIGLIYGQVSQDESSKFTVDMEGEKFELGFVKRLRKRFIGYLETNPNAMLYLRVYPKFNVVSKELSFETVGFYTEQPQKAQVNQFLLAGIWQYIPKLPDQPVMSIYRNNIRAGESPYKIWTNHLPVAGFAEKPFLYKSKNPEVSANQPKFYELVVSFDPQQREFNFLLLRDSTEKIPKYVKRQSRKPKPKLKSRDIQVTQMNFSVLQKTAMKLRESGFFEGKVSGKGVTKESLTNMVQDSLTSHPEAAKALESVSPIK
ncbi:MAG: hypothetical protein WBM86_05155 [Waterburya sp.]